MIKQIIIFFGGVVFLLASGEAMGQYSIDAGMVSLSEGLTDVTQIDPGVPDTLISKLDFDIEVFIEDSTGNRDGASHRRDGNSYISTLKNDGGLGLDSSRLRTSKPVALIFKIPSKSLGQGQFELRGVTTNFNEHFNPTATNVRILPGRSGIEIRYFFKNGIKELPDGHEHLTDEKGIKTHVMGHVCDPDEDLC